MVTGYNITFNRPLIQLGAQTNLTPVTDFTYTAGTTASTSTTAGAGNAAQDKFGPFAFATGPGGAGKFSVTFLKATVPDASETAVDSPEIVAADFAKAKLTKAAEPAIGDTTVVYNSNVSLVTQTGSETPVVVDFTGAFAKGASSTFGGTITKIEAGGTDNKVLTITLSTGLAATETVVIEIGSAVEDFVDFNAAGDATFTTPAS